jgi:hypothetical protein
LEGAIRHQSTNTHPILVILLWTTIGSFLHGVDGMNVKVGDLLVNYRKILHSLNDFVELSGNLLNQKLVSSIVAGCGWATNANWLKHCIPGSSYHFSHLKKSHSSLQIPNMPCSWPIAWPYWLIRMDG